MEQNKTKEVDGSRALAAGLRRCAMIALLAGLGVNFAIADDTPATTITPSDGWTNLLSETKVKRRYAITDPERQAKQVAWSLSVDHRTIARGQIARISDQDGVRSVTIEVTIPKTRPGVSLEMTLEVSLVSHDPAMPLAQHQQVLTVFGDDPFALRAEWLKGLQLQLYDPVGETADLLSRYEVPFTQQRSLEALASIDAGLVILGEGISPKNLSPVVSQLLKRGVSVLWLAPAEGTLLLPGISDDEISDKGDRVNQMAFRRSDVISELDPKLDAHDWPPDGKTIRSRVVLRPRGTQVVGAVVTDGTGWPWVAWSDPQHDAKVVLCGFGLIEKWDAAAAPRYLLVRLLEFMSEKKVRKAE